ncbi:hypothetical protein RI129_001766 [Pyrocoelia pectoralis]|uniref:Uncharacterized protein n=1 Tax=Pyrocoelia pectoralis TaxID=417401 RepID=A0AAN7ZPZ6_9COLE
MKLNVFLIFILLKYHKVLADVPFDLCFYHSNDENEFIQCGTLMAYRNQKPNGSFAEMEKIHIGWNTTMQELRYGLFSSFTNLKALHLSNSHIESVDKRAFYNMEQLIELRLFNNKISELDPTLFKYLKLLKILDLGGNKLTGLEEYIFHSMVNLEELELSWNRISSITKDLFYGLNNLRKLNLAGNALKSMPEDAFSYLSHLLNLDLSYNDLKEIPLLLFYNQTDLQTLSLESNELHLFHQGLFDCTVELTYLDISDNFITSINGSLLNNTVTEVFKFERNLLTEIDISELLQEAQFLEELYFDHNPWNCNSLKSAIQYLNESQIYVQPGVYFAQKNVNGILCH